MDLSFTSPLPVQLTRGLQLVPNALTTLSSKTSIIYQLVVSNYSGADTTFLVQDANGLVLIPTVTITAGTVVDFEFFFGAWCSGGISWQAGAANALNCDVLAFRQQ